MRSGLNQKTMWRRKVSIENRNQSSEARWKESFFVLSALKLHRHNRNLITRKHILSGNRIFWIPFLFDWDFSLSTVFFLFRHKKKAESICFSLKSSSPWFELVFFSSYFKKAFHRRHTLTSFESWDELKQRRLKYLTREARKELSIASGGGRFLLIICSSAYFPFLSCVLFCLFHVTWINILHHTPPRPPCSFAVHSKHISRMKIFFIYRFESLFVA